MSNGIAKWEKFVSNGLLEEWRELVLIGRRAEGWEIVEVGG